MRTVINKQMAFTDNGGMREMLAGRIGRRDIRAICLQCCDGGDDCVRETLFSLISDDDDRVAYNALWVLTHFDGEGRDWLLLRRSILIDRLLTEKHTGKRRLMLSLLDKMPVAEDDVRTDYLDFCMAKINSTEPYGIRALCLKQAFAQCRFYPELLHELKCAIEMMEHGEMSAGIRSARNNIMKQISRL